MAITSTAGATLTRTNTEPNGLATSTAGWAAFQVSAWIKTPSLGARTLVDYTTAFRITTNASNQIQLTLDGVVVATATTPLPVGAWAFWRYRRTTSGATVTHTLRLRLLDPGAASGLGASTTEITLVATVVTTPPTTLVLHVPAGCAICSFKIAAQNKTADLSSEAVFWVPQSSASNYRWLCPLRFPNDPYDHREVSSATVAFFAGMHAWTSQSGTLALDPADPGPCVTKSCSAVLGQERYGAPLVWDPVPQYSNPGDPAVSTTRAIPLTIRTDVLPDDAVVTRLSVGGTSSASFGPDFDALWNFPPDPTLYLAGLSSVHIGYYDWSHIGAPSPSLDNPSTGQPWAGHDGSGLADLYAALLHGIAWWDANTAIFGPPLLRNPHALYEVGLACLYIGNTLNDSEEPPPEPEPDDCVLDRPSTTCWGESTPSAQCRGAQPSGPSASSTWSPTFSPDAQRVGLKDS